MTMNQLTAFMFSTEAMQAVFSSSSTVQRMLDAEAALARAEAHCGVIPPEAVQPIADQCRAERIDLDKLAQAAGPAGNLAIPLVKQLTARVAEADAEAAKYVHWGATSQDIIDTGMVLQLRDALDVIGRDLAALADALAAQAVRYKATPLVGRTWMQHALPITLGLKLAGWLDGINRHQQRLADIRSRLLFVQFGGAAGTLASLGDKGLDVAAALAQELGLQLPDTPWHTQRDRITEVATTLGMITGSLGKMARDVSLHMQTDVGELSEPVAEGKGGSSTMPHKRNPVGCAVALTAAVRVPGLVATMLSGMVQEHERALGGWQAEWDTLPEIAGLTAAVLQQMVQVAAGLGVSEDRLKQNLDATHGQILAEAVTLALGAKMGRLAAHKLVEKACQAASAGGRHLREVLGADPAIAAELSPSDLDRLLDPANYTGQSAAFVERVLATHRQIKNTPRHQE
ncbi:3-carboxy-cis,cis-muconate cycloisomerase [Noviherbaspirillum humi]|uniref:3-carboxy-cis,cis-muconate cycloisomerase n=1 Tax=Noviherbaspirillum humi TaxID=1688639 RepID=A0A239M2T2_9BURK|nr:3-carboxy-cis,cis-muconate cycloisomerase [Noviherbaspirillum humi]SNT36996.1 3-carboxy-cis,cis-muconate cycloisomerase [Noviherbaspirillum humi]